MATFYYDVPRSTNDLDYAEVVPREGTVTLQELAGPGAPLARKHRVHFQHAGVASLPEGYVERLVDMFPGRFARLSLLALEPHDLALSKLSRNSPVDREDVARLARSLPLDADLLRRRYREELRPAVVGDLDRYDRTLELWIQAYFG